MPPVLTAGSSWGRGTGAKPVTVDLGGRFHRSRIKILSSQVSTLAPHLTGRWTKPRRLGLALSMLEQIRPSFLITHRFHISQAAKAYELLDHYPEKTGQVMLSYEDSP